MERRDESRCSVLHLYISRSGSPNFRVLHLELRHRIGVGMSSRYRIPLPRDERWARSGRVCGGYWLSGTRIKAFLKVVVWGGNRKQAEEDDEVEEVTKYVVPLLCARARCGWRRAGGRGLKIIVEWFTKSGWNPSDKCHHRTSNTLYSSFSTSQWLWSNYKASAHERLYTLDITSIQPYVHRLLITNATRHVHSL